MTVSSGPPKAHSVGTGRTSFGLRCRQDYCNCSIPAPKLSPFTPTYEELTFVLNSEMYSKLEALGWDRDRWQTYEYGFIPLSVGCEMYVRDTLSDVEEHLTKDACW